MQELDTRYMFKNKWLEEFKQLYFADHSLDEAPAVLTVENGTILPYRKVNASLGLGGLLDSEGNIVKESCLTPYFGGEYSFDADEVEYIDDTIVFASFLRNHWGHFLVDLVCRLWYPILSDTSIKVAFCVGEQGVAGNFKQFFEAVGIHEERLLPILKPTRVKKIILPEPVMGFYRPYRKEYIEIMDKAATAMEQSAEVRSLKPCEKVYFTRTAFAATGRNEFGEDAIETAFKNNGFKVLAPEKLSLAEQIFYIRNSKIIASLSGTIPHNIVFAKDNVRFVILNRTCIPNAPQFTICQMRNADCTYVDVYSRWNAAHPKIYGDGPLLVGVNSNLRRFFKDNGFAIPAAQPLRRLKAVAGFVRTGSHKIVGRLISKIRH